MRISTFYSACFLVFVICLPLKGWSQIISSVLHIHAVDSVTRSSLAGVQVTIICEPDTLHQATDEHGQLVVGYFFRCDSVRITAQSLGYAPKEIRIAAPPPRAFHGLYLELTEKQEEIAEIIVTGSAAAVVIRGDTVIFNSEAYKTFTNDPLRKLFELLPGMEMMSGVLSYMGETIDRITIDGERLFNHHADLALEHIRADDVVDVRVFKEKSDQDQLDSTANPRLQTVVDVRTKSKPSMIRQTELAFAAGSVVDSSLSQPAQGARKALYEAEAKRTYSRVGETLAARVAAENTASTGDKRYYAQTGSFLYTQEERNTYRFTTDSRVENVFKAQDRWSALDYFPSDKFDFRTQYGGEQNTEDKLHLVSANRFERTFKNRDAFRTDVRLSYSNLANQRDTELITVQDGNQLINQHLRTTHDESPYSIKIVNIYSKALKRGRLNVDLDASFDDTKRERSRADTVSSSTAPQDLLDVYSDRIAQVENRTMFSRELSQTIRFMFRNSLTFQQTKASQKSHNRLTAEVNPSSSFDHTLVEFVNTASGQLIYRKNDRAKGFNEWESQISWHYSHFDRKDRFPQAEHRQKEFSRAAIRMQFNYKLSAFGYVKMEVARAPYQNFSPLNYIALDDLTPGVVRIANPDLKPTIGNSLSLTGRWMRGSSTYQLRSTIGIAENAVITNARYIMEDTYLQAQDYLVKAGSRLTTREHVSGQFNMGINGSYATHSSPLKSIIEVRASYQKKRSPVYVVEKKRHVIDDAFRIDLNWTGNFSSRFVPTISMITRYQERSNGLQHNQWLEPEINLNARALLTNHIELNAVTRFNWIRDWPAIPGRERFGTYSSVHVSYLFDQKGNLRLQGSIYNLIDQRPLYTLTVEDEYTQQTYHDRLGRYALLRLQYRF